jgi:hypothetical protein
LKGTCYIYIYLLHTSQNSTMKPIRLPRPGWYEKKKTKKKPQ